MGLLGWVFYIFLGILFFFIIGFIQNKYIITKLEKFIISIILMLVTAGICNRFGFGYTDDIFLVFVFLLVTDVIYNSYFIEKDFFDKSIGNVSYYVLLIIVSFLINQEFINKVGEVFLTGEDLRLILWSLAIIFAYQFCKNKNIFSNIEDIKSRPLSKESVLVKYAKLKYQYYDVCDFEDREFSNLIYAIMIFEDNQRSKMLRKLDYFFFRLNGNTKKLGIMQVETDTFISDIQSIEMVSKKLEKYKTKKRTGKSKVTSKELIEYYSKENSDSIEYIFDIIKKF